MMGRNFLGPLSGESGKKYEYRLDWQYEFRIEEIIDEGEATYLHKYGEGGHCTEEFQDSIFKEFYSLQREMPEANLFVEIIKKEIIRIDYGQ